VKYYARTGTTTPLSDSEAACATHQAIAALCAGCIDGDENDGHDRTRDEELNAQSEDTEVDSAVASNLVVVGFRVVFAWVNACGRLHARRRQRQRQRCSVVVLMMSE
jgi:hypothetical protein